MNKISPAFSIVVPIYNVEQYLYDCVSSIRKQTLENIEIILVDDGSPDRCGELADSLACQDNRIKVVHRVNGGLGPARNTGIDVACGEYIGFVDSDDCFHWNEVHFPWSGELRSRASLFWCYAERR